MTMTDSFPPKPPTYRLLFMIYEGFEILDLAGPVSVFNSANYLADQVLYQILVVSRRGGPIRSAAGPVMESLELGEIEPRAEDTLLVMGAEKEALPDVLGDQDLLSWLASTVQTTMRYGSVCAGAFVLAQAGLLDDKRATTHWAGLDWLRRDFPDVSVIPDAIYVRDGCVWTSAGVTTGIDMALAMVAEDAGTALMGEVAKRLVVHVHRQGDQTQKSSVLDAQVSADGAFATVIAWIEANLAESIRVMDMAEQAGMSERNFYRKFSASLGVTPSHYLVSRRMARAKQLLDASLAVKVVSSAVGYASEARFRKVFREYYGRSPSGV